jgi:hypothetical protein
MVPYENWYGRSSRLSKLTFNMKEQTCHTSNASMREIESYFGNRIISKNLWPSKSLDLTPPDFFLWGLLKGHVYSNKPRIQTWRHLISTCGVYWRVMHTAINREQLTPSKTRYGGRLLPLPMLYYQMSSPICRLAYKSAWMLEGAIFSICSTQTLFCNIQGKYVSNLIGNHTKI